MATTKTQATETVTFIMDESPYGTPIPTLLVSGLNDGREWRARRALALRIAAEVELHTPAVERWCVQVTHRGVEIELSEGDRAEAERARMTLLASAAVLAVEVGTQAPAQRRGRR